MKCILYTGSVQNREYLRILEDDNDIRLRENIIFALVINDVIFNNKIYIIKCTYTLLLNNTTYIQLLYLPSSKLSVTFVSYIVWNKWVTIIGLSYSYSALLDVILFKLYLYFIQQCSECITSESFVFYYTIPRCYTVVHII